MTPHSSRTLPPLIVILGPTASGKTDLAVELAKEFNGEIINADSRQVYREIDIASAKPKLTTNDYQLTTYHGVPHHLFDVARPDEEFNVTHFKNLAVKTICEIHARGKLPVLVGGTGLWIAAVVDNFIFPDVTPNPEFRTHPTIPSREGSLSDESVSVDAQGGVSSTNEQLYQQLIAKDPDAVDFINPKNRRRIIRALEIIKATGAPFSAQRKKGPPLSHTLMLGLTRPIQELEERIAARIKEQLNDGLEEEERKLFLKYDARLPALSSISVREWKAYFDGAQSLAETLALIRLHNRQYAKRQMTWFKRDKRIHWIENKEEAVGLIHKFHSTA